MLEKSFAIFFSLLCVRKLRTKLWQKIPRQQIKCLLHQTELDRGGYLANKDEDETQKTG